MRKLVKRVIMCGFAAILFWCGGVLSDRQRLGSEIVRFHVVANSNTELDQFVKLQIRDAVMERLHQDMQNIRNVEEAKDYLQEKLPLIQKTAENTLRAFGCEDSVIVTLAKEAFDTRHCDAISLPAGLYNALRITIGNGEGKNWWCVMFPELCIPRTDTAEITVSAGFSERLTVSLMDQGKYRIRFAVLDVLGTLGNIFFSG